ncbi:MAG: hypothetical protein IJL05_05230 [Alphaproteobacteria bacterium]|nr:hypothetical protein [Alphaproteobacteria bacterium]
MNKMICFFKKTLPFFMTIFLWRLSVSWWNPAGILALIPVFYYTFVRPVDWFVLFGGLICFLIDYRCGLPLFWTCLFILFYAVNGFQNYIDTTHMENNAWYLFMFFIGFGMLILMFSGLNILGFVNNLWLFMWLTVLYIPITAIDKWVKK